MSWMECIPDDYPITMVSMPGTHDSITYCLEDNKKAKSKFNLVANTKVAIGKTQHITLQEQLEIGVRFFDIRVDGNWCGRHGSLKANIDIFEILDIFCRYLHMNPSEFIIMRLKTDADDRTHPDNTKEGYKKIVEAYGHKCFWMHPKGEIPSSVDIHSSTSIKKTL